MGGSVGDTVVQPTHGTRREAQKLLRALDGRETTVVVHVTGGADLDLPIELSQMLVDTVQRVAEGRTVVVTSVERELTTTQAAKLLEVSRPTLTKLLDDGRIPHRRVGTHRRVKLVDLLHFQDEEAERRRLAYDRFVEAADRLGLDDGR